MIKQGNFINVHGKVAIVVSRFNETITKNLVDGATSTLKKFGIKDEDIDIYWVPGAFEIGFTAKKVLETNKYTGIMTLGAVIKGETDHYAMIINNVTSAIMQLNLKGQIPITFGMLTTENIEQALQRAGLKAGNEGSATAQSLLEMMSLNEQITK
ncbi:6,7-dimethyl-8-ribityllumazine synthase [Lactobacillus jensenii]|jgi:6,7-dimethyl-8-ribityllumazine synthase|uniref:6,7-dimethyl-8-ribityllumazine synthase n=1 Tax=Lactobacillus jensenii TaxID=109790 RepID=A0A5N1IGP3_LACJE|nr:6,7-dimethyl-8-ribityllumazine synthase [Lactobacillus jensenii]APT13996.1 6,7-dimethyl-8-ribityllumazine synthase [Lactobacillus jensenii]EEQ23912.1 6,7-dimethyl-8-ribityllumazine synthase [Lactobacillus jensenii 269-3]EEX26959.1 6,7-dimethyl-8-ribityllumazine synthase [Lactobacillus jensenii SJ-7A-US]KAA9234547.1 6,7-dimethyl-8-ribityllumazine synthase [Lactobacillus jensenii]KAA9259634.1 6,7-dimethyl-8-ribityllumazine synthase [Lactobacillus jensenii]